MANAQKTTGAVKNRPVHVVRYGSLKAAVWLNQTSAGAIHNVTVTRSYKDGEEWKESSSFGYEDLLPLAKALDDAHSWIHEQRQKPEDHAAE